MNTEIVFLRLRTLSGATVALNVNHIARIKPVDRDHVALSTTDQPGADTVIRGAVQDFLGLLGSVRGVSVWPMDTALSRHIEQEVTPQP